MRRRSTPIRLSGGGPVEGHGGRGPPVDQEGLVVLQHGETADVEPLTPMVGGVTEGQGPPGGPQLVDPADGVHGPIGTLTDQGGLDRGLGHVVLVEEVPDALLGHLRRLLGQPGGVGDGHGQVGGLGPSDPFEGPALGRELGIVDRGQQRTLGRGRWGGGGKSYP